ncbi:MAG: hypothetical protein ACRD04_00450 [Terriglobales bacterium]
MRRPGTVLAVVVLELLGSAFTVAFTLILLLAAMLGPAHAAANGVQESELIGTVVLSAEFAAWGIQTALGLLWMRRWALASTLIFSGLLLFAGLSLVAAATLALPLPAAQLAAAHVLDAIAGLILFGLALWWILYFIRAETRSRFYAAAPPRTLPVCPCSIMVIAVGLIASAGTGFVSAVFFRRTEVIALGWTTYTGAAAQWSIAGLGIATLAIGLGLLERRPWARLAAMALLVLGIVDSFLLWLVPGALEGLLQAQFRNSKQAAAMRSAIQSPAVLLLIATSTAAALIALYFLGTRKSAFQVSAQPVQTDSAMLAP